MFKLEKHSSIFNTKLIDNLGSFSNRCIPLANERGAFNSAANESSRIEINFKTYLSGDVSFGCPE